MTSWLQPTFFEPRTIKPWPFSAPNAQSDTLVPQAYSLIMIDAPWRFELYAEETGGEKSPQAHYNCMSIEDIAALPVGDLAAPNCLLWAWATAPMFDQQIHIVKGWGFTFCTSGVWVKTTRRGKIAFGTGYVLRGAHEPFILATRGEPKIASKSIRSVIMAPLRENSRKPDEAYAAAEALMPRGRKADVFTRERRSGWESFGDEVGKFNQGEAS